LYPRFDDYHIAFEDKKENSVNSVRSSWTSVFTNLQNKMKCWVGIVSTPTADTPGTTLLLHFDAKRYLIGNVSEGTQRVMMQRQLSLGKLSDIFLTGPVRWNRTGGILGMILTIADSTTSKREAEALNRAKNAKRKEKLGGEVEKQWLNIHGGENLSHTLATARRFIFRKGMPVHTREFRAENDELRKDFAPTWKDDFIQVWAMVLQSEKGNTATRKRSHDDFASDTAETLKDEKVTRNTDQDRNDQLRKGVVSSMFDSEWKLDALVTKKLSEVERPTQIFFRSGEGKIEKYQGPLVGEEPDVPDIDVLVRNPWPGALIESLPPTKPVHNSISYIIKGHPQRGKFDPKSALALGVKPPQFKVLTAGESVVTDNGTAVTPDQVMGPGKEGGGLAVIDLPDTSYIKAVVSRKEWSSKEIMNGVEAVVWILGPGVVYDPILQNFMKSHSNLKHIVSSTDTCSNHLAMQSPASAAIRLNLLDAERFPVPKFSNNVPSLAKETYPLPYEKARVMKIIQLEPKLEVQDDKIVKYLDAEKVVEEASSAVQELADEARKTVTSKEYLDRLAELQRDIPCKDAEVITLGTGSAAPSKYRNVSATLLRVPGFGTYLFDCGENTLGQLKRVLGKDLPEVLRDLKVIWISHLHADHHLGTTSVIQAWNEATKDNDSTKNYQLVVASDDGMINWLSEYSTVEDFGYHRLQTIAMSGRWGQKLFEQFDPEQTQACGLSSIQACRVEHCAGSLAVVFSFPNGFKVAYSGDCRPSREFARIGQKATLLIHEATFDDELQGDAYAKKHSTTSEALNVGRDMGARRILLTHFSQRYQKIPMMGNADGKDQVAIVAFDYMRVKIEDFAKVVAFRPALIKLYENVLPAENGDCHQ
jgi:ribonuclease Z